VIDNATGEEFLYYDNGAKKSKTSYLYGQENGKVLYWYRNSQLKEEDSCENGSCWIVNFWGKEGNKTISNGTGKYISYYSNGMEEVIGWYQNGKRVGKWKWYYLNGEVEALGEYDLDGRKIGKWIWKYNNGEKYSSVFFNDGVHDGADSTWNSNGELKKISVYKNGTVIGNEKNNLKKGKVLHNKDNSMELEQDEKPPEFVGGREAMVQYINRTFTYPSDAARKNIQGKVKVFFIVSNTGKVVAAKVVNSVDELLDEEALRIIENMPDWIPSTAFGIPVNYKLILPINFKLD
jgi:protein TonB